MHQEAKSIFRDNMQKKYDLIVFGATGFTGSRVAREAAKRLPVGASMDYTWAIAGKDADRLEGDYFSSSLFVLPRA